MIQTPPTELESQEGLLGCACLGAAGEILTNGITSASFTDAKCRMAWEAVEELVQKSQEVSIVTLKGSVSSLEVSWLSGLEDKAPTASNWSFHAFKVKEAAAQWALWELSTQTAAQAVQGEKPDELIAAMEAGLLKLNSNSSEILEKDKEAWKELCDLLAEAGKGGAKLGLDCGVPSVDNLYKGFRKGTLNVLAARPGAGKSAFACNMALHAAKQGHKVLVFTAEMMAREYTMRLAAIDSGEDIQSYMINGWQDSAKKLAGSVQRCSRLPIGIVDSVSINSSQMRSYARKVAKTKLDLVIVDYLQLYKPPGKSFSRENEVGDVSTALKQLSAECDVPVLALAQMNRGIESRDSEPRMSDLRESGRIEQDADTVAFLWWDAKAEQLRYLLKKNRNGQKGGATVKFTAWNQRFMDLVTESSSE